MSTRSRIAKQSADGSVTMIYCHSDGYVLGVGQTLFNHYQDESKIEAFADRARKFNGEVGE